MECRGLNDPDKHRPFTTWLHQNKPLFGAILESHIKEPFLSPILANLCPGWCFSSNHLSDHDGRIILIWRDTIKVQVLQQSSQCITCKLQFPNKPPIFYTTIYASNLSDDRVDLWAELIQMQTDLDLDSHSWILGGDLNQIAHPSEHSSPHVIVPDGLMYQLQDCLMHLGVFDLRYIGPCHTWTNSQSETPIAKKLDRLLVNSKTILSFPNALATFLPPSFSDHAPCIIDLAFNLPQAGTKPFKFQNYLTKHPMFAQLIQDAWTQARNTCQTLAQLCWKLKPIKRDLKTLNRENFTQIQERVSEAYRLLQSAQVQALQDPNPSMFQMEKDLHQKWSFLREIEELFFRQKSRITWLREGDLNTAYFLRICKTRVSYNAIRAFLSDCGTWITDPLLMSSHAINHF